MQDIIDLVMSDGQAVVGLDTDLQQLRRAAYKNGLSVKKVGDSYLVKKRGVTEAERLRQFVTGPGTYNLTGFKSTDVNAFCTGLRKFGLRARRDGIILTVMPLVDSYVMELQSLPPDVFNSIILKLCGSKD